MKKLFNYLIIFVLLFSYLLGNENYNQEDTQLINWIEKSKNNLTKFTLDNGLTVILYPQKNSNQVFLQIYYNIGTKDEQPGEYGYAHLVEHMLFLGTENLSNTDIEKIASQLGVGSLASGYNAETSLDYTRFYFNTDKNNWPTFLEIMADCMQNASFKPDLLKNELKTIFNEINLRENEFGTQINQTIRESLFSINDPYHHPVWGYKNNLLEVNQEKIKKFYKKNYGPNKAILTIIGNTGDDVEKTIEIIKNIFDPIKNINFIKNNTQINYKPKNITAQSTTIYKNLFGVISYAYWSLPGSIELDFTLTDFVCFILQNKFKIYNFNKLFIEHTNYILENFFLITIELNKSLQESFWSKIFNIKPVKEQAFACIEKELEKISLYGLNEQELCKFKEIYIQNKINYTVNIINNNELFSTEISEKFFCNNNEYELFDFVEKTEKITNQDIKDFINTYLNKDLTNKIYVLQSEENIIYKKLDNNYNFNNSLDSNLWIN